jgi:hypothetical protein
MGASTAMADYLAELRKDTPMGRVKLLAAWDSLSSETQIRLLREMSEKGRTKASDRPIWLKALSSPSEYVRYLAAREMRFTPDDEIENKIMSDASPLVRSSRPSWMFLGFHGKDFDRLSKEGKLAVVSDDDPPPAEKLARWIEHAAETKSVSDDEIYDVVLEYLCNPEALRRLQKASYGFHVDEGREAGFNALSGLLPKVASSVGHCLVGRLPWRGVYATEPPREMLTWLETSPHLESLLWREDAPLMELRRKIFFSTDPKYDGIKPAAVSANFYLGFGELNDLFDQNSKLLETLATFSRSLSPVMLLALNDSHWKKGSSIDFFHARRCEELFESALAKLRDGDFDSPYGKDKEIRFLRVYRLAKSVMDWNGTEPYLDALPEPLKFLGGKVVKGDPWGTFLAFEHETANRRFDDLLPSLEDLNLAEESVAAAAEPKSAGNATDKQGPLALGATASPEQGTNTIGNTVMGVGILAALLTILFAVGGILDNEYRNFGSGVIAMAISAGAIAFAGSQLRRNSR